MGFLSALFGGGVDKEKVQQMIDDGAIIIDVRSPMEFQGGHVAGSRNYPLQNIQKKALELQKLGKPLVLCCASGNRSGQAARILQQEGIECENGGGWMTVNGMV